MRIYRQPPPLLLGLLMLALGGLAGCGSDDAPEPTVTIALDGAPSSLDPAHASSVYASALVVNLYDTLYRYRYLARPYELAPNLAAAMPAVSDDGLRYRIRLRDDARFIDDASFADGRGRAVTADDVVYSLLRHFDPDTRAQGAWLWRGRVAGLDAWAEAGADYDAPPAGLRVIDAHTLEIVLVEPYPQLVHTLAHAMSAVVPREAVEHHGPGLQSHAVGSGPFRLASYDSARAELERNPGFRSETFDPAAEGFGADHDPRIAELAGRSLPLSERLVVEFIGGDAARWNALISGDVDLAKVPVQQFDRVLASRQPPELAADLAPGFRLHAGREAGFVKIDFNMADPRIGHHPDPERERRNRALRCAIVEGFDWSARNRVFFDGVGEVFPGVIPPAAPEFDPAAARDYVVHDPASARALLAEHGWTAETVPTLEYGFESSVTQRQMFEQFRSFMATIGWPEDKVVPLSFGSFGEFANAYLNGEVMLISYSWTMDYPDAENTLQLYYGPNAAPGSNAGSFRDAEFDRLFELARSLPPSPERTDLFRAMNQRVMAECATISGLSRTVLLLWNRRTIMQADRSFVRGFGWRYAALDPAAAAR